jgi:anti-sigma factor ChrR (cupin superfamily)
MIHDRPADDVSEQLTLHALGLLDDAEADEMEAHVAECPVCQRELVDIRESAASVSMAAALVQPRASLRARVLEAVTPQVWKKWAAPGSSEMHLVRDGEGEWERVREGVYAKQLYVDRSRDMVTMLVRMDPGARYVSHRHAAPEQCFVLEGDIRDGDVVCRAGDFQVLEPGSVHGAQWTKDGCLVLIVSSLKDELLV